MSSGGDVFEGASCRPNISPAGIRRRLRLGAQGAAFSGILLAVFMLARVSWWWRFALFLPAAGAALSLLQARRRTCVMRAAQGTIEHDDFTTTPATDEDLRASRRVSRGVRRDAVLIGLAAAALAASLGRAGL